MTPNVDHVIQYQNNVGLRTAYAGAALVVTDGKPVLAAARLLGRPLPGLVAGSDLVPELFAALQRAGGGRVFLLGAGPGVGERAAQAIAAKWPAVEVVGTLSPPFGFERDAAVSDDIVRRVNETAADVLVIGLGAPKQELWVSAHASRLQVKTALCVGATIDFLAGEKQRAPVWVRRLALEWLFRACSEPKRLGVRYAKGLVVFPMLVLREMFGRRSA